MIDLKFTMVILGGGLIALFGLILLICHLLKIKSPKLDSMKKGYLPWLVMGPLFFLMACFEKWGVFCVFSVISLLAAKEYLKATGLYRDLSLTLLCYAGVLLSFFSAALDKGFYLMPFFLTFPILIYPILRNQSHQMLQKVALTILAVLILGWFSAHLVRLKNMTTLLFLVVAVELSDASAFIWGKLFGKRKIVSHISPNKTLGGLLGALATLLVFALIVKHLTKMKYALLSAFVIWVGAVLGDLFISLIKREVGIKDMGTMIPGHGGILDRFDSLLFAAPLFVNLLGDKVL